MRKKSPVALISGVSLLVLLVGVVLAFSGSAGARDNSGASSSQSAGRTVVSYPPGVPAIQPRASLQGQGGPAFTTDDVVHYIQTQGLYGLLLAPCLRFYRSNSSRPNKPAHCSMARTLAGQIMPSFAM